MKSSVSAHLCVAGVLALGVATMAQEPAKDQAATKTATEQQVTVTGCVVREADYRSATDAGKGGVAGTGVGSGNEFVLTNAKLMSGDKSEEAAGATGTSGSMTTFELTGSGEGKASEFVGQKVEITGTLKAADTSASGKPTGGATAGQPPSGVDVASKDLKLRELDVASIKATTGDCPPVK